MSESPADVVTMSGDVALLSSNGGFSFFSFGGDVIKFATSPSLRHYIRVKRWDKGYAEVDIVFWRQ